MTPDAVQPDSPRSGSRDRWLVAVVVVALSAGSVGFLFGSRAAVSVHTGSPMAGEHVISVEADGWTYGIPEDIDWKDSKGAWHDRGRPDCIPPLVADLPPVTFGAVDVQTPDGVGWRAVVWVICH